MNGRHFESVPHCEKSFLCNSQSEAGYSSSIFFLEMLCVVVSGPHNRMILSKHQHFFLHKWESRCVFCAEIPVKSSGPPVAKNTSIAPKMDAAPDFKSYFVLGGGQPFANAKCMSL